MNALKMMSTGAQVLVWVMLVRAISAESTVFTNDEISVDFAGTFAVRETPGETQYSRHLAKPLQTIDFCKWQPQPPEVQQVMRPERGFLCELHVLPAQTESRALAKIRSAHSAEARQYVRHTGLKAYELAGNRVIRWRFQAGKTRLDHYLLLGKKYHYLFVSSPYGSTGTIEAIIERVKFR